MDCNSDLAVEGVWLIDLENSSQMAYHTFPAMTERFGPDPGVCDAITCRSTACGSD